MAIRSLRRFAVAVLAVALLAACGGTSTHSTSARTGAARPAAGVPAAFAWLHPAPPPPGWSLAHLIGTTTLAYPPGWRRIHSDPGTVAAARVDRQSGLVVDYLNATPQQGEETLQNWATFRPDHDREEGDSRVHLLASAKGLRFRNGRGSCVIDRYRTSRTSYQEIACLVRGSRGTSVIVAAAVVAKWRQTAAELERAVSAFVA
jgi:hypothetical protein